VGEPVFTAVSVAGAPQVEFCVDPDAGDPVAAWLLEHDEIDEFVHRVFLGLVEPSTRILDLGCHLGTFSLAASALGGAVIAVDAGRRQVELIGLAAARNAFDRLEAVHGAVSTSTRPVAFVDRNIHGHLALPGEGAGTATVTPVTVDGLLERFEWDGVDLVKLDIEGAEYAALDGMKKLFARGERPDVVFECNGAMLPLYGGSTEGLRARLERLGYELFLIDNLRPGILVETPSDALQPECVSDYVATVHGRERFGDRWTIEPRLSRAAVVTRLLDQAASAGVGYRRYAAQALAAAPRWLREDPAGALAARTLALDCELEVREPPVRPRARWAVPPEDRLPADLVVFAREVSLRAHRSELDHLTARGGHDPRPALEPASFHVRRGQLVGLCGGAPATTSALLHALAGHDRPASGTLHKPRESVYVGDLAEVLELELPLRSNIEILAAYLGDDLRGAQRWIAELAARAGVGHRLDAPLAELTGALVVQLVLGAALESARGALLLLDRLPPVADPAFRAWVTARSWQLRREGVAVVQAVGCPDDLVGPPDRLLWFEGSELLACGHPDSVADVLRRRELHLDRRRETHFWSAPA
jgi:FkbM family methyltransferase